jgi:tripartite-type tricarboxylate transporter receptor subunit TctC
MDTRRRQLTQLGMLLAAQAAAPIRMAHASESAEAYPSRSIRLLIPFAVGGGTDIIGREIGQMLGQSWRQPVVVDNKAGGNGIIGLDMAAKADPDGYTLTMITASSSVNVTLQGHKQPYDLIRDFAPITQITTQPYVLVVNPNLPVKSVADLIALARSRSAPMTYGSSGVGGLSHLSGALFGVLANINLSHIPYKGGSPALSDVVSGQIDMLFSTRLQAHGLIEAQRVRALAVTTAKRSPASPELPTMEEAGVPGYEVAGWYGMLAPARTPKPIVEKLNREILRIIKLPSVNQKMAADGSEAVGTTPEQFDAHIRSEVERWRKLIVKLEIPTE